MSYKMRIIYNVSHRELIVASIRSNGSGCRRDTFGGSLAVASRAAPAQCAWIIWRCLWTNLLGTNLFLAFSNFQHMLNIVSSCYPLICIHLSPYYLNKKGHPPPQAIVSLGSRTWKSEVRRAAYVLYSCLPTFRPWDLDKYWTPPPLYETWTRGTSSEARNESPFMAISLCIGPGTINNSELPPYL